MNDIKLFEVGGSIRDELMGLQSKDRTFVPLVQMDGMIWFLGQTKYEKSIFNYSRVFYNRIIGKDPIDIVMCRKDGASSDGRRPDFVEAGTILDDLSRRDFTMNAIARQVFYLIYLL